MLNGFNFRRSVATHLQEGKGSLILDSQSQLAIGKLTDDGIVDRVGSVIREGKESVVFHGSDANKNEIAIKVHISKVFREDKKKRYLFGDWRYRHAKRKIVLRTNIMWAEKEFRNLLRMEKAGVRAPRSLGLHGNVLAMTFIGKGGVPAPQLNEVSDVDFTELYREVLKNSLSMVSKAKLVHGDLSPYNILVLNDKPLFIDVSQTVLFDHPLAMELLERDVSTVNDFFHRKGVSTLSTADLTSEMSRHLVVGKPVDRYGRKYRRGAKYRS
jgi:RIO kinase 1